MAPSASILFPTRGRREYLAVALRSVAPQAAAHGAEIVVIEDDAADPATERLVTAHGGRYVALGEERGINVARNAAVEAAAADLLCFIDDDVEAWPGWLARDARGRARQPGPRGARRADPRRASRARTCTRAAASRCQSRASSSAEPTPTPSSCGARTSRSGGPRSRASARSTSPSRGRRRRGAVAAPAKAAGGRIRYVAAAGVDHRRVGATRSCARSPGPTTTAAATPATGTPTRAPLPRSPASCARWRAASGTRLAAAAATGSCSRRSPSAACARPLRRRPRP